MDFPLDFLVNREKEEEDRCLNPDIALELLREQLKLYEAAPKLAPRAVIRQRAGASVYRFPGAGYPAIFIGYLPNEDREWNDGTGADDCEIAVLRDDVLLFYRVNSRWFEVYPEEELAAR